MRAVITDAEFVDLGLEQGILEAAGFDVSTAQCRTPEQVIEAARDATALLVQYAPITGQVIDALDELRVVTRYGVGVDNVDTAAAERRGVWVVNVPDYGAEEVATHTLAMVLAMVRHLPFHDRAIRAGTWSYQAAGPFHRLSTLTLGLVGVGRIGRTVVERSGDWFARVVAHDPHLPAGRWPADVEQVGLDELFDVGNVISLHLPLTDDTAQLVNRDRLSRLPDRGAYLVNTARGGLVDLDALLWSLDEGRLRGAALDVMPEEPPDMAHPVLHHPRTLVTPHAAWYSEESEEELRRQAAESVAAWATQGRPPVAVVEGRPG